MGWTDPGRTSYSDGRLSGIFIARSRNHALSIEIHWCDQKSTVIPSHITVTDYNSGTKTTADICKIPSLPEPPGFHDSILVLIPVRTLEILTNRPFL